MATQDEIKKELKELLALDKELLRLAAGVAGDVASGLWITSFILFLRSSPKGNSSATTLILMGAWCSRES